ncbi:response regulator transcription factor [Psychroflexus lacisalsi]|jgi:DNA-binding response OmpR family regulator|uniref:Response regulator transcription factor n=1 Tax=Psychroflexus lacisalsi TaxID=503928 RepID=A0ABP3VEJ2_9FLAO|nr:response regulator transcription factor [Psychroflexus lacisalsi]MBZ9619371.1 response regulator transcription factor [Psychroflexus lacisalsi]
MNNADFTILIAEDETEIAKFIKQGLFEEGFQVKAVKNGQEAVDYVEKHHVDLALLDWMMPEVNGLEACKILRSKSFRFPIIFLTAKDSVENTIEGLKSGANDYIKKPFHFSELLARIEIHLKAHYKIGEVLELGFLKLDTAKHLVYRDDVEVNLTDKEYQMLCYLIRNKGQVCSRQKIIEDVWDIHFEYDTSVLDVHMNALRKKLNLDKNQLIKTIRGAGFIAEE